MTTPDRVREALHDVVDPCSAATGSNLDIVEMGLVKSISVADGEVSVDIRLTTPACMMVAYFLSEIERQVEPLTGVDEVTVTTDAGFEWSEEMMTDEARARRQSLLDRRRRAWDADAPGPAVLSTEGRGATVPTESESADD